MPVTLRRIDRPELMDTQPLSPAVLRRTLRFLAVTNRRFGGAAVILDHLRRWSRRWTPGESIRIADVGSGGAEIPVAIAAWARERGFDVRITALDLVKEVADIARENTRGWPEIDVRQEDVFELIRRRERFDYVTASLFLHHIPPARNVDVLRGLDALARRGLIVSDLERSVPSLLSVGAISYLIGNRIVRHDGPLSVRRAFRVDELEALARESGLRYLRARREPWFRLSLAGEKNHAE